MRACTERTDRDTYVLYIVNISVFPLPIALWLPPMCSIPPSESRAGAACAQLQRVNYRIGHTHENQTTVQREVAPPLIQAGHHRRQEHGIKSHLHVDLAGPNQILHIIQTVSALTIYLSEMRSPVQV